MQGGFRGLNETALASGQQAYVQPANNASLLQQHCPNSGLGPLHASQCCVIAKQLLASFVDWVLLDSILVSHDH